MKLVFRDYGGEPDKRVSTIKLASEKEPVFKVLDDDWRIIEVYREEELDVYVVKIAAMYNERRCTSY